MQVTFELEYGRTGVVRIGCTAFGASIPEYEITFPIFGDEIVVRVARYLAANSVADYVVIADQEGYKELISSIIKGSVIDCIDVVEDAELADLIGTLKADMEEINSVVEEVLNEVRANSQGLKTFSGRFDIDDYEVERFAARRKQNGNTE